MEWKSFLAYLAVMAGVTYLTRMAPLTLFRRKITSRFVRSFLSYVPYGVLTAMTLPGILYSTGNMLAAAAGLGVAYILAWRERTLLTVAVCAAAAAAIVGFVGGIL